jgi:glycosyltransferase involved in cell wall biosynthesis
MKVLHVSDSFNAGVKHGIESLVSQNPQHEHFLLWASHSDSPSPTSQYLNCHFASTWRWEGNLAEKYFQLLRLIPLLGIDGIHLHSSIAGALGRLIPSKIAKMYSPHCFAFQRNDISPLLQKIYLLAEYLLSRRKCVLALCWPIEVQIAEKYFGGSEIVFTPIVELVKIGKTTLRPNIETFRIATVGRIRPQKDPLFLTQALKNRPELRDKIVWIGSGDSDLSSVLENSNVEVIPWMRQEDIWNTETKFLATCIPSSWESGPLTLFESLSAGYPVICRDIPALNLYGFQTFHSPTDFAHGLEKILESESFRSELFRSQVESIVEIFKIFSLNYAVADTYDAKFKIDA